METNRPLILITNDDSINAPGILCLAKAVAELGDVYIVAPAAPHSGQSAALTVGAPLRITEQPSDSVNIRCFVVTGTPVDCVKIALHTILPRRPDLVLSGINHGSNSGVNVTYSGTMGAALEGCMNHIPAIGFSLLHHSMKADFSLSVDYVTDITRTVLERGLPDGVCLNVNIPAKIRPEGIKICRAARGYWTDEYRRYLDPQGVPFYWLTGHFVNEEPDATDTDEYWLQHRHISVVPVAADQTAFPVLKDIAAFFPEE